MFAAIGGVLVSVVALVALLSFVEAYAGYIIIALPVLLALWAAYRWQISIERRQLRSEIEKIAGELLTIVRSAFQMDDCSRCHESEMRFVSVSPNAHSVEYQCIHCGETMYGKACSADAQKAKGLYQELCAKGRQYIEHLGKYDQEMQMAFSSEGGVTFKPTEK